MILLGTVLRKQKKKPLGIFIQFLLTEQSALQGGAGCRKKERADQLEWVPFFLVGFLF